ncbi:epoxyqueuosine reductase [Oxobacter pfennigii]|uniref:Epoxyqueuosine reductase n=2 Tax=Oxobacter pfennigii TaxID=36849 RepID=A0A0P8Y9L3_9CLOT|nr:epoxyqueuosine reductase [Oxobacter pfennigii]
MEIEAWITDRDMELVETTNLPKCPEGCSNCIKACPARSLSDSYTMNPITCVSYLTTFGGRDLDKDPLSKNLVPGTMVVMPARMYVL